MHSGITAPGVRRDGEGHCGILSRVVHSGRWSPVVNSGILSHVVHSGRWSPVVHSGILSPMVHSGILSPVGVPGETGYGRGAAGGRLWEMESHTK